MSESGPNCSKLSRIKIFPFQTFRNWSSLYFVYLEDQHQSKEFFSIMKNMWSDDRSNMHEQNVKALLKCKSNINLTCTEFYKNIKSNVVLLKKVLGTDKYYH